MLPTIRHSLTDNVKDELMRYIRRMDLSESTKLPSELTIAQNLGVSRITVCRVLGDLEQENVIFRIHGKGTFVNPEAPVSYTHLAGPGILSEVCQRSRGAQMSEARRKSGDPGPDGGRGVSQTKRRWGMTGGTAPRNNRQDAVHFPTLIQVTNSCAQAAPGYCL